MIDTNLNTILARQIEPADKYAPRGSRKLPSGRMGTG
jgi:hypothetical protein